MNVTPTALFALLELIYNNPLVRVVLVLLAVNVLTGVAAALYHKSFALGVLADWLYSRALPYVIVAGAFQVAIAMMTGYESVLGDYSTAFTATSTLVWAFVIAALVGHIGDNLKDMGLPIPDMLTARGVRGMLLTSEASTVDPLPPAPPSFTPRRE